VNQDAWDVLAENGIGVWPLVFELNAQNPLHTIRSRYTESPRSNGGFSQRWDGELRPPNQ